jgi:nitroimidazol reductase NimA-like FMN-containing flavoprotein (pyridoxamine 5'-phosphate oxidase superfamily)
LEGEKYDLLHQQSKVTFSVYQAFSYIPSYFISDLACQATIFFKSAHIRGIGSIVEDLEEKKYIVIELMKKHQPE